MHLWPQKLAAERRTYPYEYDARDKEDRDLKGSARKPEEVHDESDEKHFPRRIAQREHAHAYERHPPWRKKSAEESGKGDQSPDLNFRRGEYRHT